jgi:hypothetical protein
VASYIQKDIIGVEPEKDGYARLVEMVDQRPVSMSARCLFRGVNNKLYPERRGRSSGRSSRHGQDVGTVAWDHLYDCEQASWQEVADVVTLIKKEIRNLFSAKDLPPSTLFKQSEAILKRGIESIIARQSGNQVRLSPWESHHDCLDCVLAIQQTTGLSLF